jgi:hypothetical protein
MDELIDSLLVEELVCDIALPHLPKRIKLEQLGILEARTSKLDIFDDEEVSTAVARGGVKKGTLTAADILKATKSNKMDTGLPSEERKYDDAPEGDEEYINEFVKRPDLLFNDNDEVDTDRKRRSGSVESEDRIRLRYVLLVMPFFRMTLCILCTLKESS